MLGRGGWQQLGWALPWLLFLAFPVVDLVATPRPVAVRVVAGLALLAFTGAYLGIVVRGYGLCGPTHGRLAVVAVLGVALAVWLGPAWSGLMIYLAAAAAATLPVRRAIPVVVGAAAVCAGVVAAHGLLGDLFILPVMCLLTAFALQGTRRLMTVNAELAEARDELARNAVAEERLRFARDLHDLLGHSLSLIALKSELAGRLAERDPARARQEMADVEAAARQALAEVRDAVSGYRQVNLAQALAEARSALSAAGIALRAGPVAALPDAVDGVLGWVVREATTNVLRHSGATSVTVELAATEDGATLSITDDGRGPGDDGDLGSGLAGLAERLAGLGGRLEAGAAPGGGFRLRARVPVATGRPAPATAPGAVPGTAPSAVAAP
jgi:two-component system sensor histidine kinase DesK